MRNVDLRVLEDVVVRIQRLRGRLVSQQRGAPPVFDDNNSFVLEIDSAEIAMATPDLGRLMNEYVFAYPGSPLKKLDFSIIGTELRQDGVVRKGVDVPFTVIGGLTTTPEGKIRFHAREIKAAGVPVRGLLEFFGLELDRLVKLKGAAAVRLEGNDLLLDPETLLPPPRIRGKVTEVRLEGDRLVEVFGSARGRGRDELLPSPPVPKNFLYFRENILRFGKLTMTGADLLIYDADPSDPFDFFQERYNDQLVAGYSKNTPDHGLRVVMPDFGDLDRVRTEGGLRPDRPQ